MKNIGGVLNLIITGIPSIRLQCKLTRLGKSRFKPYYNWNTFNTALEDNKKWLDNKF